MDSLNHHQDGQNQPPSTNATPPTIATFHPPRTQSTGRANTWRHALARGAGSHYKEIDGNADGNATGSAGGEFGGALGGEFGGGLGGGLGGELGRGLVPLERLEVRSVAIKELLQRITPTYVKMDIEGAEIEVMDEVGTWPPNVTRLVFEWSFTKEREIKKFAAVVGSLEEDGWAVMYDGRGGAWEKEETWPPHYFHDLVVFAAR